ncbi:MAG: glycoside hydrolase family 2 TIM barrel-domain containing protein [Planctomycetota bacterium]|jgi:hypothetical protein
MLRLSRPAIRAVAVAGAAAALAAAACSERAPKAPTPAPDGAAAKAPPDKGAATATPEGETKAAPPRATGGPSKVLLEKRDGKWVLIRNGEPFYVKGAGGETQLALLARSGGNSTRTWGADGKEELLDRAHALGLAVTIGIWLGHERHGFDYSDAAAVAKQKEAARKAIIKYKDHPALLMWGIGNEMEGFKAGDDTAIWRAVNDVAAMAKVLDPNHPTMTVTAEIGGKRVVCVRDLCPAIDVHGINSYGGTASLPKRYREAGGVKPYVVTEYGPNGTWEIGRNAWGVAEELTSTAKARAYRERYEALRADAGLNLGSYAFVWGNKNEATATWFGMFLPDGTKLGAVDALTEAWSGRAPANRCPEIASLELEGPGDVAGGAVVRARLRASDPEGDPLDVKWVLAMDPANYATGGGNQAMPPEYPDAIGRSTVDSVELKLPKWGRLYRLFAYVRDGKGGGAVANVPVRGSGPEAPVEVRARKADLPLVVYDEKVGLYAPSGWMGDTVSMKVDLDCAEEPRSGKACIKVAFNSHRGWGGVVWQNPDGDWGERPGGRDLTGATKLVIYARGGSGGEKVKFGYGILGRDKKFFDTASGEVEVELSRRWREYVLYLDDKDLRRIKTGFYWSFASPGRPVLFYLDDIRYEAD